jgi:hypothetical protein
MPDSLPIRRMWAECPVTGVMFNVTRADIWVSDGEYDPDLGSPIVVQCPVTDCGQTHNLFNAHA